MRVSQVPGGPIISKKFSPSDRIIGVLMLLLGAALITAVVSSPEYNFWTFSSAIIATALLVLPGAYFAIYTNEVIIDPNLKCVVVRRGWFGPSIAAEYDFEDVQSVLSARKDAGKPAGSVKLYHTILRFKEGGLVFSSFTKDESGNSELAEKLSRVLGKPVESVKENEEGDGYVPA